MSDTIPITLPGRPVTASLPADALPRYLAARGWSGPTHTASEPTIRFWRWVDGRQFNAYVPLPDHATPKRLLRASLREIARFEHRHPLDVLADLLPPSSAPVAWAHLSERQRALALDVIAETVQTARRSAAVLREQGEIERALEDDGKAAALLALAELGRRAL